MLNQLTSGLREQVEVQLEYRCSVRGLNVHGIFCLVNTTTTSVKVHSLRLENDNEEQQDNDERNDSQRAPMLPGPFGDGI